MLEILGLSFVIPVVVIEDAALAAPLAQALLKGGIKIMEITLRTPAALIAIKEVAEKVPGMRVGAGTLVQAEQFAEAKMAKAAFAVSPGLTPALAAAARAARLPYLPGVATVSEALLAQEQGFTALKFFPAEALGGVKALKAISQVLPNLRFCPTGGITAQSMREYLTLSSVPSVGGTWLTPPELIKKQDWQAITALAQQAVT